ncbi:MAG: hypothetical protein ABH862_00140 [Candidatus Omnitrophota bacterium]
MINRNLGIAFLIALSVHVLGMSAVSIVPPQDGGRMYPYTRIDFLGSILRKAAFDIMLEDTGNVPLGSYDETLVDVESLYLDEGLTRIDPADYSSLERFDSVLDILLSEFLTGKKIAPNIVRIADTFKKDGKVSRGNDPYADRNVRYRPQKPYLDDKLYGKEKEYRVVVRMVIDQDGKVKKTEPVSTTGLPEIDNLATEFAKEWIFEPDTQGRFEDQILEAEIILVSGEDL